MKNKNVSYKFLFPIGLVFYLISHYIGAESYVGSGIRTLAIIINISAWADVLAKQKLSNKSKILMFGQWLLLFVLIDFILHTELKVFMLGTYIFYLILWGISSLIKKILMYIKIKK